MCHRATGETAPVRMAATLFLLALTATAQTAPPDLIRPAWRKIGSSTMDLSLASPATGPVSRVWFSNSGGLYALTAAGRVFESADMEHWAAAGNPVDLPSPPASPIFRAPVPGAKAFPHPRDPRRVFALSRQHLYRSDNGGESWTNITAFGDMSVIGSGQRDIALSPDDPDLLIVANDFGVWRSADGGLSWSGLNVSLPNLQVRRILATPAGMAGTRAIVEGNGLFEVQPGGSKEWRPIADSALVFELAGDEARRRGISLSLGVEITATAGTGDIRYAGAIDGRIWISSDRGVTWRGLRPGAGGAVESFYVDADEPRIALAVLSGQGPRVLRTINTGVTWDDLSSNLPDLPAHAIAVDRPSGSAYVATGGGLFFATVDMDRASAPPTWTLLSTALPEAPALDVKLDPGANQLFVAIDGYGVFATLAPHRARQMRLVNAADFSSRAAAPGSVISVLGGRILRASAGQLNFPVLYASDADSQIQIPFEAVATSPASISLALDSVGRQFTFGVPFQAVSPAIFIDRTGAPILLDDNGMMFEVDNPARAGARIQILTTGLGKVTPDWPTGMAAPLQQPPAVRARMAAYVDRTPVEVLSATLAPGYVGMYLVEIQLPSIVNAGPAELYITADGQESNRVGILLEP